jgi:antitoxin component YwqK of YwqJK toxin-antitoxin module
MERLDIKDKPDVIYTSNNHIIEILGDNIISSWYDKYNKLHRKEEPAYTVCNRNTGQYTIQHWYKHGNLHRNNNLPAKIEDGNGEFWYKNGILHRTDGPAAIFYVDDDDGRFRRLTLMFYQNGILHCDDGPAYLQTITESWYKNGLLHRIDGPAIHTDRDGTITESWYVDGILIK